MSEADNEPQALVFRGDDHVASGPNGARIVVGDAHDGATGGPVAAAEQIADEQCLAAVEAAESFGSSSMVGFVPDLRRVGDVGVAGGDESGGGPPYAVVRRGGVAEAVRDERQVGVAGHGVGVAVAGPVDARC